MPKFLYVLVGLIVTLIGIVVGLFIFIYVNKNILINKNNEDQPITYDIYVNDVFYKSSDSFRESYNIAKDIDNSVILKHDDNSFVWKDTGVDSYTTVVYDEQNGNNYSVFTSQSDSKVFSTFNEAIDYANTQDFFIIYDLKSNAQLHSSDISIPDSFMISKVPEIQQLPELPRGCEVTSLAMLLRYKKIDVNKMDLANKITKDETPYQIINGQIHFGNPNIGFVGDIMILVILDLAYITYPCTTCYKIMWAIMQLILLVQILIIYYQLLVENRLLL